MALHTLKVKATDRAGNAGTQRRRFKIARKLRTGVPLTARARPLIRGVTESPQP